MSLDQSQLKKLLGLIASTSDDPMDCDGCFEHIAMFAESELIGRNLCEIQKKVKRHLENCVCCQNEYQHLLEALKELQLDLHVDCPEESNPAEDQSEN